MASRMKDLNVFEPDAMQLAARKVILEFGTPLSMLCNCRFTKALLLLYMFSMTDFFHVLCTPIITSVDVI